LKEEDIPLADQPAPASLPVPTADERTMALLAHLLQIFAGFIAPLVIYFVKRESEFVKFHALQALIWQLCYTAFFMTGFMFFFLSVFTAAATAASHPHGPNEPPAVFVASFLLFWFFCLLALAASISNLILAVVCGVKANRGEWARYPIIGKWCLPKTSPRATSSPHPLVQ
jgi:uncharacterized Tic20 family protein